MYIHTQNNPEDTSRMVFSMFDTCFVKNYCANPFDKVSHCLIITNESRGFCLSSHRTWCSSLPPLSPTESWPTSKRRLIFPIWSMLCIKNCTDPTWNGTWARDWFLLDKGGSVYKYIICTLKRSFNPPLPCMYGMDDYTGMGSISQTNAWERKGSNSCSS